MCIRDRDHMDHRDHRDHGDHRDHKDHRDHRDHKPPIIRGQRINQWYLRDTPGVHQGAPQGYQESSKGT